MKNKDIMQLMQESGLYEYLQDNIPGASQWAVLNVLLERFTTLVEDEFVIRARGQA